MSSIVPDVDGLICAFELKPLARRGRDVLTGRELRGPLWLHFNLSDGRSRKWLEHDTRIPSDARDFLLHEGARIHLELFQRGFGAVLGDLHHDFDADPEGFGAVRLYVDAEFFISVRLHPLKTADVVRRDLLAGFDAGSTIGLFEHFVERLAETFGSVVADLGEEVDEAEDRILSGHFERERMRLGRIRRLLARLRRHVSGDRSVLAPLPSQLSTWGDAEDRRDVQQAIERLAAVAQDLDLVQERARLLQEEIAGRVGEATNRNIFVLSTMTTVLLPVTLITGIFGMNVVGLPLANRPHGFWWVLLTILGAIALALVLLHKRRVL